MARHSSKKASPHTFRCALDIRARMLAAVDGTANAQPPLLQRVAVAIHQHCGHSKLKSHRLAWGWTVDQAVAAFHAMCREAGQGSHGLTARSWKGWEAGDGCSPMYQDLLCRLLSTGPVQLGFATDYTRNEGSVVQAPHVTLGLGPVSEPVERVVWLAATNVDEHAIDLLKLSIFDLVCRYETDGPLRIGPEAVALRRNVDVLLRGHQHPEHRRSLYGIAGRLSALLGYMAVNHGQFVLSAAYCREAFNLASAIEDAAMQAWVRGTESFCAYYMGEYGKALELARDGQRYAKGGEQAVRLAINGEARALGKLGDRGGVDEAVGRSYGLIGSIDTPRGLTSCISLGPYGKARIAANAATAYLSLGDTKNVLGFAGEVEALVATSDSAWSKSLVRLDVASALLRKRQPEIEEAMALGAEAISASGDRPIRSVWQRARELEKKASPWGELGEVRDFRERLNEWTDQPATKAVAGDGNG